MDTFSVLRPLSASVERFHQTAIPVPTDQRIFKVPADQRKANPDAYEPYLFSFGPYHAVISSADAADAAMPAPVSNLKAYREALSQFERSINEGDHFKLLFAKALLTEDALGALVNSIQRNDAKIRNLYIQMPLAKLKALSASSFALRLALDSITIVAAALDVFGSASALMAYHIVRLCFSDAILLENQVPILVHFLVIQSLPQLEASSARLQRKRLREVLEWYRKRASPFPSLSYTRRRPPPAINPHSTRPLLHYVYKCLTGAAADPATESELEGPEGAPHVILVEISEQELESFSIQAEHNPGPPVSESELAPLLPSASYLIKCGVKFRACDAGFQGIEISESGMTVELSIPRIAVTDSTVRSLHNLLAYEATTRYPAESFVISFVHFMDRLIDTREDVQVLVDAGVIRNFLGSHEELAAMWNKLCISVNCRTTESDRAIMAKLEALAQKRWRKWWASYKEKYWKEQPWLIASVVGAIILLVLTFLQTIYTMKGSSSTA